MVDRTAEVPFDPPVNVIGLHLRVRIAGVKKTIAVVNAELAAEFFAAGFGEDLDAAHAKPVVLGGKRVLVDADFANGTFGRQFAAAETVYEQFAAVRPGGGAGQHLQSVVQIVGVVRQG